MNAVASGEDEMLEKKIKLLLLTLLIASPGSFQPEAQSWSLVEARPLAEIEEDFRAFVYGELSVDGSVLAVPQQEGLLLYSLEERSRTVFPWPEAKELYYVHYDQGEFQIHLSMTSSVNTSPRNRNS